MSDRLSIFKKNLPAGPVSVDLDLFFEHKNDPIKMRSLMLQLEDEIKGLGGAQVQVETTHRFADGLYIREIFIPKNTIITGKIHKQGCVNICSKGEIIIISEDGISHVEAPFTACSKPWSKKVGIAQEDTIWITVHATTETDVKKIENKLCSDEYDSIEKIDDSSPRVEKTMEGLLCHLS